MRLMRRAAALCLLLVMSACGEERLPPPTAPTVSNVPSTPVSPGPRVVDRVQRRESTDDSQFASDCSGGFPTFKWPVENLCVQWAA